MDLTPPRVDLHAHTLASDGGDTPEALVAGAARAGLELLAVTDHDTVEGVGAAVEAGARLGVEVLPGCEITSRVLGRAVHLLAYGAGLLAPGALDRVRAARRDLAEREHRALIGHGTADAFERYLSDQRPAYVAAPSLPLSGAVELVHDLGGVALLAHPGRLAPAEREGVVAEAIAAGVDGLEVWHPEHHPAEQRHWLAAVRRHGLLATGGSDHHGVHNPTVRLGGVAVPRQAAAELEELLARRAIVAGADQQAEWRTVVSAAAGTNSRRSESLRGMTMATPSAGDHASGMNRY